MARYYNPDTGVFLSLDPVRGDVKNPLTMNEYNYGNNNPVMNVDPDGKYSIRADGIKVAIDIIMMAIPGMAAVYALFKIRKNVGKAYAMLNGAKIFK